MQGTGVEIHPSSDPCTGAAWLSSARVVKCWVKSRNERNPCFQLPSGYAGDPGETAGDKPEEGGDDVKSSWPLRPGLHTCYNGWYKGLQYCEVERIPKSQPQFGLESATRLHEVGIASIAYQNDAVNTFPGLVHTARQVNRVGCTPSR